jgi:release factor glutamine methyltransferase
VSSGRGLLADAVSRLAAAGVASPRVDAELLLAHVLRVPRGRVLLVDPPDDGQRAAFAELIARRERREPLQYLLGTAAFRHLELAVGPGVFIPRPETELLVDAVLPALAGIDRPRVVDLCAGSGALGLAVVSEHPAARVIAVERDPRALRWLRRNAAELAPAELALDGRFTTIAGDLTDPALLDNPVLAGALGGVDAVLCNPPYVPSGTTVGPEVERDPPDAVFAGPDGMALMPYVCAVAARLARPGARLAVEHSETHGTALVELLGSSGMWADVVDHLDLAGRPRFVTARRSPG